MIDETLIDTNKKEKKQKKKSITNSKKLKLIDYKRMSACRSHSSTFERLFIEKSKKITTQKIIKRKAVSRVVLAHSNRQKNKNEIDRGERKREKDTDCYIV